jgi:hypothetical protein
MKLADLNDWNELLPGYTLDERLALSRGGGNIGPALVFGWLAGEHAAAT